MLELHEIPTLPEEIKHSALDGTLVIFVGNGASRLLGCPSWDGLADLVLRQLAQAEIINYGTIQRLQNLEAKKKLLQDTDDLIDEVITMRQQEGAALASDLKQQYQFSGRDNSPLNTFSLTSSATSFLRMSFFLTTPADN